jgi:hypothetical protein
MQGCPAIQIVRTSQIVSPVVIVVTPRLATLSLKNHHQLSKSSKETCEQAFHCPR